MGACQGGEGVEGCGWVEGGGGFGHCFFGWVGVGWWLEGGGGGVEEGGGGGEEESWFWKLCSMSEWVGLQFLIE